jgi:hypothetical protein
MPDERKIKAAVKSNGAVSFDRKRMFWPRQVGYRAVIFPARNISGFKQGILLINKYTFCFYESQV